MRKPIIGITLDYETTETYSKYPWYALRENYITAIEKSGGIPLPLPHEVSLVDEYFSMIDGLVITGGNFDVDPKYYGEDISNQRVIIKDKRTQFEFALCKKAIEFNLPILGICGGEQLANVVLGGSLIQHIPDEIQTEIDHEQKIAKHLPSHEVLVHKDTLLYAITKSEKINVNSTHHQAVKNLGKGVIVSAVAPDGVIEAIEKINHKFCLCVQWHPEYYEQDHDKRIFDAFIKSAAS